MKKPRKVLALSVALPAPGAMAYAIKDTKPVQSMATTTESVASVGGSTVMESKQAEARDDKRAAAPG